MVILFFFLLRSGFVNFTWKKLFSKTLLLAYLPKVKKILISHRVLCFWKRESIFTHTALKSFILQSLFFVFYYFVYQFLWKQKAMNQSLQWTFLHFLWCVFIVFCLLYIWCTYNCNFLCSFFKLLFVMVSFLLKVSIWNTMFIFITIYLFCIIVSVIFAVFKRNSAFSRKLFLYRIFCHF